MKFTTLSTPVLVWFAVYDEVLFAQIVSFQLIRISLRFIAALPIPLPIKQKTQPPDTETALSVFPTRLKNTI